MNWLDRQSFLGPTSDRTLDGLTVAIVGLGGGGSHVAQQLAHVGVGSFVLLDDDAIDETNLNRLVGGTAADVRAETSKVDIAARTIRAVNPRARVRPVREKWERALDELRFCDVVFGCVDSVRAKDGLEAFCRRLLIPYLDQGMDVHELAEGRFFVGGQVLLSVPGAPCLRCLNIVTDTAVDAEARNYGAAGGKPQVVWPNGVLASTAVGLFMQLVTPWHHGSKQGACLEYDGNENTVASSDRMLEMRARACPHRSTTDIGDPLFDVEKMRHTAADAPAIEAAAVEGRRSLTSLLRRLMGRRR